MMETILVVEDDSKSAMLLRDVLQDEGYTVLIAPTGAEGRAILNARAVALLVLDLRLPDMDGIELLKEAQRLASPPDIVIITAHASLDSALRAIELGAAGYLLKPIDLTRLRSLVNRLFIQQHLKRENADLYQSVNRERRRLEGLFEVARRLATVHDADQVLDLIVREASRLLGVEAAAIRLLEGEDLVLRARTESAAHVLSRGRLKVGESLTGLVVQTGEPIAVEDLAEDPRYDPAHKRAALEQGFHAFLSVPLRLHGQIVGTLSVYGKRRRGFLADDISLLYALGDQTSLAIEKARLLQQEQERRRHLEAVRAVSEEIVRELDLAAVLRLIIQRAAELAGAKAGAVYLWQEAEQDLIARAWVGHGAWIGGLRIRLGQGVTGMVAERRQGMIDNNYGTSAHRIPTLSAQTEITAVLAEPLVYQERLIGVITIDNSGTQGVFSEADRETLGLFATQAAIAIQNARLFEETQAQRTRLAQIFESASDAILTADGRGNIVSWNKAARRIFGYDESDVVGKPLTLLMPDQYRAAHEGGIEQIQAGAEARVIGKTVELTGLRKDGGEFPIELSLSVWRAAEETFFTGIIRDITERKQADQMKSDFVSFVTHQLRTPLSGIKWLLELAGQEAGLPEEAASYITDAQEANERLIGLVNDLLDVSRLERGKIVINPKAIDLGALTQSVLEEMHLLVAEKGHRLSVSIGEDIPPVWADPQLLRQVVLNLVSNAVKYTPAGGAITVAARRISNVPEPQSHIAHRTSEMVKWAITDSGIGIPKAAQARLFEKFYRAENVLTVETEGTGLGLYLVRLILDQFQGKVWCESEEGQGATFSFALPISEGGKAE